jgi:hypothetical protein
MFFEQMKLQGKFDERVAASGFCATCGRSHSIALGYAVPEARRLLSTLLETRRVDFEVPDGEADPRHSLEPLFGEARGHMFGVLVCRDKKGATGVLKAFSGQMNGVWMVDGWVPPLVDVNLLERISNGTERYIKRLGQKIEALPTDDPERAKLVEKRRALSRALMKDIHGLYRIPNFLRQLKPLSEVVTGKGGIPSGTGDCCAPKLLGYAARHSLTPLGLAEFYVGRENKAGTKRNGAIYASCKAKCGRILGHMLCGLEEA